MTNWRLAQKASTPLISALTSRARDGVIIILQIACGLRLKPTNASEILCGVFSATFQRNKSRARKSPFFSFPSKTKAHRNRYYNATKRMGVFETKTKNHVPSSQTIEGVKKFSSPQKTEQTKDLLRELSLFYFQSQERIVEHGDNKTR